MTHPHDGVTLNVVNLFLWWERPNPQTQFCRVLLQIIILFISNRLSLANERCLSRQYLVAELCTITHIIVNNIDLLCLKLIRKPLESSITSRMVYHKQLNRRF